MRGLFWNFFAFINEHIEIWWGCSEIHLWVPRQHIILERSVGLTGELARLLTQWKGVPLLILELILTLAIFFQLELKCVWKMCRESRKPSVACITCITNTFPRPQHCDSRPHRHTATNTCVVTVANSELNVGYSNNNISANSKHIYMIFISF